MRKKVYMNTTLVCKMQEEKSLEPIKCHSGVISRNPDGSFVFEESVRKVQPRDNPRLFNGQYCALVHMKNGKYKIHMKSIDASQEIDPQVMAYQVYEELLNALNILF